MALRDNEKLIATRNIPEVKDIKAENVLFTPTDDITSTNVQSAIVEVNDNASSIADDLTTHTDSTVVSESGIHGLRYFDGKLQAYVDDAWVDVGGGSSPFGATIKVIGLADSDIGQTITLTHNGEEVSSTTVPDTKAVEFKDIMAIGEYVATCNGADYKAKITIEDVFSKNVISIGKIFEVGNIYKIVDCEWMAVADNTDYYTLIMTKGDTTKGVMSGYWPGYIYNNNKQYTSDYYDDFMADSKCRAAYTGLTAVYEIIKKAQYGDKGFYLVSPLDCNVSSSPGSGQQGSGYYCEALKTASANFESFGGMSARGTWLGRRGQYDNLACIVEANGRVSGWSHGNEQGVNKNVVAPTFDLDTSKVYLSGDEIKIL